MHNAGIDITSGHAADSFFNNDALHDPWMEKCVVLLIDTLIYYDNVYFALPCKTSFINDNLFPKFFQKGCDDKLLKYKESKECSFTLAESELEKELNNFTQWANANNNFSKLERWLELHFLNDNIKKQHKHHIPVHEVDHFLSTRTDDLLIKKLGLQKASYAFDVFARTIQYCNTFGDETTYIPHPVRIGALKPSTLRYQSKTHLSWGRYFVEMSKTNKKYRDLSFVYNYIPTIKEEMTKLKSSQDNLKMSSDELCSIAERLGLPATMKKETMKYIRNACKALVIVSPCAGLEWFIISVLIENVFINNWNGDIDGSIIKSMSKNPLITAKIGIYSFPGISEHS